jgi:hypothetical protein
MAGIKLLSADVYAVVDFSTALLFQYRMAFQLHKLVSTLHRSMTVSLGWKV